MEWLANIKIEYVIAVVILLLLARLYLGRFKTPAGKSAAEIVESALIAIVLVFLVIKPFVVQAFFIPSGSMEPTLLEHDHILVNKFIYRFREPQRGDIIVFKAPPDWTPDGKEKDYIKRLIGLPGDVIEVKNGAVYRNGKRLNERYTAEPIDESRYDMDPNPVKIPQGKVWVMGDNRNNSSDSHIHGPLDANRIVGKAMVIFWPLNRLRVIH